MLRTKKYNNETKTEEAWFESSMIIYTKMVENEAGNFGELYITYKNGATYVYHDVRFEDYVVFIGGGTDGSHGKTINKIIKGAYEFEKLEPLSLDLIEDNYKAVIEEQRKEAERLEGDFNLKWKNLRDRLEATMKLMDEQKKEHQDITEEMFDEMEYYISMQFSTDKYNDI